MRKMFDNELIRLNNLLVEMGGLVETAIAQAVQALRTGNLQLAKRAIDYDQQIDDKEKDIESLCLKLLLLQQPVARDLRLISSALKIITDMERIGDQAADIAEITIMLSEVEIKYPGKLELISKMAAAAVKMVTESIDAFVRKDENLVREVIEYDDIVDALFDQIKFELINILRQSGEYGEQALDLFLVAKYLERIGDHAENIAEWVLFSITGRPMAAESSVDGKLAAEGQKPEAGGI